MTAAGVWHPDPLGEASWRWWDGHAWTGHTGPARELPDLTPIRAVGVCSAMLYPQRGSRTAGLWCDQTLIALLNLDASRPVGETATGSWCFRRKGGFNPRDHVLVQPSDQEIGKLAWGDPGDDKVLQFVDGRTFRLADTAKLEQEGVVVPYHDSATDHAWAWVGADRVPIATVRLMGVPKTKKVLGREFHYKESISGVTSRDVWIDIHPAAAAVHELPLLTVMGVQVAYQIIKATDSAARERRGDLF